MPHDDVLTETPGYVDPHDRLTWATVALIDITDDLEQNVATPSLIEDCGRRLADVKLGLIVLRSELLKA